MAEVDDGAALKMPSRKIVKRRMRVRFLPAYGSLTTSGFREEDSQAGAFRLKETTSTNIPLATRVMAGPAGKLKW